MEGNINNNGQLRIETASGVFARFEVNEALFISNICHVTLKEYMSPNRPNFF